MDILAIASGAFYFDFKSRQVLHRRNKPPPKWSVADAADFDRVFNTVLACRPPE